jgi:RNA-directed DNA polymerase
VRRVRVGLEEVSGLLPLVRAARRCFRAAPRSAAALSFMARVEDECLGLSDELERGVYVPRPYRVFVVSDPKPRQICAAAFRDRVVHHSLCAALLPRLERYSHPHSFACRVGMGVHSALDRAQGLCGRSEWALKLDVHHFFERARHDVLLGVLGRLFRGDEVLGVCERVVRHAPPGGEVGRGLPIGNLTSQYFANLYLTPLDHYVTSVLGFGRYVRYMDDILVFGGCKGELLEVEGAVGEWLRGVGLQSKWRARALVPTGEGVSFLGCRLWGAQRRLDGARRRRLHRRLRVLSGPLPWVDQLDQQRRLSSVWAWAEACGGGGLWASWHARRVTGDVVWGV